MMEKISFTGGTGETLAARLDTPDGDVKAYALFAHCFTGTKEIYAASRIARGLFNRGIGVLRLDFTGLGDSDGDFENTNFSSNVGDLTSAADFMRDRGIAPKILIGHSLGGAAVLAAASTIPESKAVVTLAAPADVDHVAHHFQHARDEIMEKGEAEVCLAGRPFRIKKQFIEDIEGFKLEGYVKNLKKALLVMHAPIDETVGIENAGKIFSLAKHPKSYVSLDDADHLLTRAADAEYVANVVAMWAARYIQD